jgi:hypothetical protein
MMCRAARLHHDVIAAAVLKIALELCAAQAATLDDLPILIGGGKFKHILRKINGDGCNWHDGLLFLGWIGFPLKQPASHATSAFSPERNHPIVSAGFAPIPHSIPAAPTHALRHCTAMMRCRRKSIGAYLLETSSRENLVLRS